MAKSKNSSQHNQTYKDHRNGIKNVRWNRYSSSKCVNQKLLRNTRRAKKFDPKILKEKNLTKRIQFLRENKAKIIKAISVKKQTPAKVESKPAVAQKAPVAQLKKK